MKAGSTITSRDSHEVRHLVAVRQARSGCPRWKNEAPDRPKQRQRQQAALPVKGMRIGLRQQLEGGIGLGREQGKKQPWAAPIRVVRKMTEKAGCMVVGNPLTRW
jgi:hypothetical protein